MMALNERAFARSAIIRAGKEAARAEGKTSWSPYQSLMAAGATYGVPTWAQERYATIEKGAEND